MKCICDLKEYEQKIICGDMYTYLALTKIKGVYYLEASGDDVFESEIKYCPYCGHKL